jgi:uncharacterized membrane protein
MRNTNRDIADEEKEGEIESKKVFSSARIARISILSALSVLSSFIPFPSPVGTVGLDLLPGFIAAFTFGPLDGGMVCIIGHLATVLVNGPQLGIMHLPIALGMGLTGWLAGLVRRRFSLVPAIAVAILVNTFQFPLAVPVIGWGGALSLAPSLLIASSINAVTAAICSKSAEAALELAQREKLQTSEEGEEG